MNVDPRQPSHCPMCGEENDDGELENDVGLNDDAYREYWLLECTECGWVGEVSA